MAFAARFTVVLVLLVDADRCLRFVGAQRFDFQMMRNPGLFEVPALSIDECIRECNTSLTCSAISYQPWTRRCILSFCNNLDIVSGIGWFTRILGTTLILEPAKADFEWMLTSSCGTVNQGSSANFSLTSIGVDFTPISNSSVGNTSTFSGSAATNVTASVFVPINFANESKGITVMMWVNFKQQTSDAMLVEAFDSAGMRGFYMQFKNGFLQAGFENAPCTSCSIYGNWTPAEDQWNYVTFALDGTKGYLSINSNGLASNNIGVFYNVSKWKMVNVMEQNLTLVNQSIIGQDNQTEYIMVNKTISVSVPHNTTYWESGYTKIALYNPWVRVQIGRSSEDSSTSFSGQLYCLKIYLSYKDNNAMKPIANSCTGGKIRTSCT